MPTYLQSYDGSFAWLAGYVLTVLFVLRAVERFLGGWFLGRLPWTIALVRSPSPTALVRAAAID